MNILFINPPSPDGKIYIRDSNRSGRSSKELSIWCQISLAHLAGMFPQDNCKIIDCIAERIDWRTLNNTTKGFHPHWLIFNVIPVTYHNDMFCVQLAQDFHAKSVAIGYHVTENYNQVFEDYPNLDYIINGEIEKKLHDLVTTDEFNPHEPLMDLKDLPMARQDLLPLDKYYMPFIGKTTFVVASRGCPYECIFCRQPIMWQRKVRLRPIENIIEEIKTYNLKNIMFHTDTFTINQDWVYELCEAIRPLKIRWCCNSRTDTVSLKMLEIMKNSGCWMIMWGIETGNNNLLYLNRKGGSAHTSVTEFNITKSYQLGIKNWGYFMLGLLGETKRTLETTIEYAKSLPLDLANFAIASPYPGTAFYDIVKDNKWLISDNWKDYDQNNSAIVDYPDLSHNEIIKYMKRAYREFYFRPSKLWMLIKQYRDWWQLTKIGINHLC